MWALLYTLTFEKTALLEKSTFRPPLKLLLNLWCGNQQQRLCVEGRMGRYWNWNKSHCGEVIPNKLNILNIFVNFYCLLPCAWGFLFGKEDWRSVVSECLLRCIYSTAQRRRRVLIPLDDHVMIARSLSLTRLKVFNHKYEYLLNQVKWRAPFFFLIVLEKQNTNNLMTFDPDQSCFNSGRFNSNHLLLKQSYSIGLEVKRRKY